MGDIGVTAIILSLAGVGIALYRLQGKQIDKFEKSQEKRLDSFEKSQSQRFEDFKESQNRRLDDFKEEIKGIKIAQEEIAIQLTNHVTETDKKINDLQKTLLEIKKLLEQDKNKNTDKKIDKK